ncbi:MAG: agmatine deiminase family protein, partial [Proteobacteria bacterium]|nr:agmatine deiminase family protein [Pseudomonadota bacterium]
MSRIVPAEWSPHRAMWLGFPSHPELWEENLTAAQQEAADLARALAGPGGERVRLLVDGEDAEVAARALLSDTPVEIVRGLFGDIWLRDTGPIYIK